MKCVLSYRDAALLLLKTYSGLDVDSIMLGVSKFGSDYLDFHYFEEWLRNNFQENICAWMETDKVVGLHIKT